MNAHRWIITTIALALAGCGTASSGTKALKPSSPFTQADAQLFQDGIDLVGDPAGLSGRWAEDWATEMRDRVQRSDLVALVTVDTLRTDIGPEQRTTYWLEAQVHDVLKGNFGAEQLSLPSSERDVGFQSVDQKRASVLRRPLIVLAKWEQQSSGEVRPRWHVALASKEVVATVRAHLQRDTPAPPSTIVERSYQSSQH
jgi:hypothetical protein